MGISKRTRFEVFKRDKFTCQYCGKRPPDVMLEADHIVPRVEGGPDDIDNLTTACGDCNRGKAGVSLGNVAPALDELDRLASMQEMIERKAMLQRTVATAKATKAAEALACDLVLDWWVDEFGTNEGVQIGSLHRFVADLSLDQMRQAVTAAANFFDRRPCSMHRVWKYFCGVCWKMIKAEPADDE